MSENKDQGLSLLDLGPLYTSVPVGDEGKSVKVYGVSARGIFHIFQRFPEVGLWFKNGVGKKIDPKKLLAEAPGAIASIIAAGCGSPGNDEAELVADLMPIETQLDLLEAILRLTFSKGFGPFVQRIVALSAQAESLNFGKGSVTQSQPQSRNVPMPDTETKLGT